MRECEINIIKNIISDKQGQIIELVFTKKSLFFKNNDSRILLGILSMYLRDFFPEVIGTMIDLI